MNTNSNAYTIIYASVMVVIVAFLLAFVNSTLRDQQNKNIELDTKKQILSSLGVKGVKDADAAFQQVEAQDMIVAADGSLAPYEGAFVTNYANDDKSHVFVCKVDGQTKYVIPVYGAGLWGAIWGYVALDSDKDTVYGVYFSHASETPGLGAEITSDHFQGQFPGKKTMEGSEVALTVVKNGKVSDTTHQVDGISGGTITSTGVAAMLKDCLSAYTEFLTKNEEE